jgi:methylenetetrahydrofolate reductase (NADPH)
MTRIIEKIKLRRRQRLIHNQDTQTSHDDINNKELTQISNWYYSFEFFPPKTEFGLDNLLARIERMSHLNPLFMDITWGASGSTSARSMQLASFIQRYCGVDALLHITCTGMTREQIALILQQARSCGIQNILALRGDAPKGLWAVNDISGGYCHRSIDLIKVCIPNWLL